MKEIHSKNYDLYNGDCLAVMDKLIHDGVKVFYKTVKNKPALLRYPKNLINISTQSSECANSKRVHPTQKPVALMEYLTKTYTQENETVLDFTMGSGTTGVACLNTNRKFIGIELDENYFDIAAGRIKEAESLSITRA